MRQMEERKPEYTRNGKKIYNPGLVDCLQKPWYMQNGRYYGHFCEDGYPGNIQLEFDPLRELIGRIKEIEPDLKSEILTMIEEMEDANYARGDIHIRSLPSAD